MVRSGKALIDVAFSRRSLQHIAHDAFSALVNLADTLAVARHLVDDDFLTFLVSYTAVSCEQARVAR